MNVYRGDVLDLSGHFGPLNRLRVQPRLQGAGAEKGQWVPEVVCIQGLFKGVDHAEDCWTVQDGATEISLDRLPAQADRVVFAMRGESGIPESVQGDFLIDAQAENILPLMFHINQTPDECTGVIVFELIKINNSWKLKALGMNIWGTVKAVYKI